MAKFEIEIPDEDVNTVKSALGRGGALLEWEGKTTRKGPEKAAQLTNEGAALLSLAMQFVFVEIEPEDVTGPSEESIEMQQIVDEGYNFEEGISADGDDRDS